MMITEIERENPIFFSTDILYKYRNFSQINIRSISKSEIFFSSPNKLNDPEDCKVNIIFDTTDKTKLFTCFKQLYLNSQIKEDVAEFKAQKRVNDICSKSKDSKFIMAMNEQFIDEKLGVFSLTIKNDDNSLWEKYSDKKKGFCIGYDKEILSDMLLDFSKKYKNSKITPNDCKYVESIKNIDFCDYVNFNESEKHQFFIRTLTNKTLQWKYENEIRYTSWGITNFSIRNVFKAIKIIILGENIDLNNVALLNKYIDFYKSKSHSIDLITRK